MADNTERDRNGSGASWKTASSPVLSKFQSQAPVPEIVVELPKLRSGFLRSQECDCESDFQVLIVIVLNDMSLAFMTTTTHTTIRKGGVSMNETLVNVGATIKSLRERSGLTQENIAHYLKVDQSLVSKFESGERTLSVNLLEKMATLFGVDMLVFNANACDVKPLSLALRASEINEADLETISAINRIALNVDFMTRLLKNDCANG